MDAPVRSDCYLRLNDVVLFVAVVILVLLEEVRVVAEPRQSRSGRHERQPDSEPLVRLVSTDIAKRVTHLWQTVTTEGKTQTRKPNPKFFYQIQKKCLILFKSRTRCLNHDTFKVFFSTAL